MSANDDSPERESTRSSSRSSLRRGSPPKVREDEVLLTAGLDEKQALMGVRAQDTAEHVTPHKNEKGGRRHMRSASLTVIPTLNLSTLSGEGIPTKKKQARKRADTMSDTKQNTRMFSEPFLHVQGSKRSYSVEIKSKSVYPFEMSTTSPTSKTQLSPSCLSNNERSGGLRPRRTSSSSSLEDAYARPMISPPHQKRRNSGAVDKKKVGLNLTPRTTSRLENLREIRMREYPHLDKKISPVRTYESNESPKAVRLSPAPSRPYSPSSPRDSPRGRAMVTAASQVAAEIAGYGKNGKNTKKGKVHDRKSPISPAIEEQVQLNPKLLTEAGRMVEMQLKRESKESMLKMASGAVAAVGATTELSSDATAAATTTTATTTAAATTTTTTTPVLDAGSPVRGRSPQLSPLHSPRRSRSPSPSPRSTAPTRVRTTPELRTSDADSVFSEEIVSIRRKEPLIGRNIETYPRPTSPHHLPTVIKSEGIDLMEKQSFRHQSIVNAVEDPPKIPRKVSKSLYRSLTQKLPPKPRSARDKGGPPVNLTKHHLLRSRSLPGLVENNHAATAQVRGKVGTKNADTPIVSSRSATSTDSPMSSSRISTGSWSGNNLNSSSPGQVQNWGELNIVYRDALSNFRERSTSESSYISSGSEGTGGSMDYTSTQCLSPGKRFSVESRSSAMSSPLYSPHSFLSPRVGTHVPSPPPYISTSKGINSPRGFVSVRQGIPFEQNRRRHSISCTDMKELDALEHALDLDVTSQPNEDVYIKQGGKARNQPRRRHSSRDTRRGVSQPATPLSGRSSSASLPPSPRTPRSSKQGQSPRTPRSSRSLPPKSPRTSKQSPRDRDMSPRRLIRPQAMAIMQSDTSKSGGKQNRDISEKWGKALAHTDKFLKHVEPARKGSHEDESGSFHAGSTSEEKAVTAKLKSQEKDLRGRAVSEPLPLMNILSPRCDTDEPIIIPHSAIALVSPRYIKHTGSFSPRRPPRPRSATRGLGVLQLRRVVTDEPQRGKRSGMP